MKVTSFEISKKLKELGFEAKTVAYIDPETEEAQFWLNPPEGLIKAYDLETILETLPKKISKEEFKEEGKSVTFIDEGELGIEFNPDLENDVNIGYCCRRFYNVEVNRKQNESLADTAARLLILLIEKGLVEAENV